MKKIHMMGVSAIGLGMLFLASTASAQTTSGVVVSTNPGTGSVSSGSGVNLGTVTFTGNATGATVTSIPVTFTAAGGAVTSNLSNCQLYNSTGQAVSGSVNPASNGTATFTFNQAFNATNTSTAFNVRCDVAGGTPSGATFSYSAGVPALSTALNVNLDVAPRVPAGSQDVALANVFLTGVNSGASVNLSSLPITVSAGNGASTAHLTDCRVRNSANIGGSLNTVVPGLTNGGATNFAFTTPLTVFANGSQSLSVTCDVSAATPVGGTFTISIAPNSIPAVNASTGAAVTPTAVVGVGPNGLPAATSGTLVVTAIGSGGTEGPVDETPGVPNTGAGGLAGQLALILALSALIAGTGAMYLRHQMTR